MLRNKVGPVFNARNGSFVFFFLFSKTPLLSAGRTRFSKTKKKDLDQFLTLEKANIEPVFNSTAYIYIPSSQVVVYTLKCPNTPRPLAMKNGLP